MKGNNMSDYKVLKISGSLVRQLNQYAYMSYTEQILGIPCYVGRSASDMLEKVFHIELEKVPDEQILNEENMGVEETEITEEQFEAVKDTVRKKLIFPPVKATMEADTINRLYYVLILSLVDSVGVYVSKEEFQKKEDRFFFERYRKVISGRSMNEDTTYFVLSDDMEWCKEHEFELGLMGADGDVIYVEENHSREKEYLDMQLLGCCKTVIASQCRFVNWALCLATQKNIQKIDIERVAVEVLGGECIRLFSEWNLDGRETVLKCMNEMHMMLTTCLNDTADQFGRLINDPEFAVLLQKMKEFDQKHKLVLKMPEFWKQIASVEASMDNIRNLYPERIDYAYKKLQYECIPLLENMRMDFYYNAWVKFCKDEKEKKIYYDKLYDYFHNPYIEAAQITGEYKYDLTILVVAYNELVYTKQCITYLLKNIPSNIRYELILINHGSSDGTKEYFESLHPDKQIDIAINGGGFLQIHRIIEGRYILAITNDVLVMPNAIENMYKCIQSDDSIASVVATTPNIGNQQSILLDADYLESEKLERLAKENNISDPKRWEEKTRLFNPINLSRTAIFLECIYGKGNSLGYVDFGWPDHKQAMIYRQKGYKSILAKDAYCYHYGQTTLKKERKSEENAQKIFRKTRIKWLKEWHYDPSGYGQIWDEALYDKLVISDSTTYNILGINSGMGENLLKFKNLIRENGNDMSSIWLSSVTQFKMNIPDLQNLTNEMIYDPQLKCFDRESKRKYDYILFENVAENFDISILEKIDKWKKKDGRLLLRVNEDMQLRDLLVERYGAKPFAEGKLGLWVSIFD